MSRRTICFALLVLVTALVAAPGVNAEPLAQESPGTDQCVSGELCVTNEGNVETGPGSRGPVSDPPGAYVRSFITMGFITAAMAIYFMVALGGRKLPFRRRPART
jgi:hypothetical protein